MMLTTWLKEGLASLTCTEIVDRLHWYVQSGDMVVDFCCGANDFSCLMNKKLDKMGKRCSFKNYDLIQSKNDFCFEKRDWMTTHSKELPAGSQLIMGLNPPFGVRAALANKFIDQALQFKPKLLILIVPEETQRLDEKSVAYDLIWKDDKMLSGKSFYLPGSVDMRDKQLEQWNNNSPPLFLWSRPDWTAQHRRIAEEHRHFFNEQERICVAGNGAETIISNYLMEENHDCYGTRNSPAKKEKGKAASDDSRENMIEMQCDEKQQNTSLQGELDEEHHESNEMEMELSSSPDSLLNCNNLQDLAHNAVGMETRGRGICNLQPSSLVHDSKFGTEYGEASSAETVHESSSRGGGISPYQNPLFHQYGSLPHTPRGYPGSAVYNAPYGYPDSAIYNAPYGYPDSAIYNPAYGYPSSGVYNAPYGYSGSTVYNPTMYAPIGHFDSSTSDLRPPGASTISNYTSPAVVFDATRWAPTEYIAPTVSDLRPPGVSTSSNYSSSSCPRHHQ